MLVSGTEIIESREATCHENEYARVVNQACWSTSDKALFGILAVSDKALFGILAARSACMVPETVAVLVMVFFLRSAGTLKQFQVIPRGGVLKSSVMTIDGSLPPPTRRYHRLVLSLDST